MQSEQQPPPPDHGETTMPAPPRESEFLIFRTRECGLLQLCMSLFSVCPVPGTHCSSSLRGIVDSSWQAKVVMLILKLLHLVAKTLAGFGEVVELFMNTVHLNGGLLKLIQRILTGAGIVIPDENADDYWSVIGFLDPRTHLLVHQAHLDPSRAFSNVPPDSKLMADVCMMASKLAYENAKVISRIIGDEWKMKVVDVFECLNQYEPTNPTQVLMFMDRPVDARAIVVTFRGTMPFNAYDWSTDFDFSWYELPGIGRVHVGFLEALSLVDRHDMDSFLRMKTDRRSGLRLGEEDAHQPGGKKPVLAYDTACDELKQLLQVHKDAKIYVTGHSLGGALAIVFTTMLFFNRESSVTEKLVALYTFGQPRVGDKEFAATMSGKLRERMFRVVYSNDLVPRIPFDDFLFQFKHVEPCCFYTSFYKEIVVKEEPNENYFSPLYFVLNHVIAVWELVQSFVLGYRYGDEFKESTSSLVLRLLGLVFPGVASHSPVNYVNSVRLGPDVLD